LVPGRHHPVAGIVDPGEVVPPQAGITDASYSPDAGYSPDASYNPMPGSRCSRDR